MDLILAGSSAKFTKGREGPVGQSGWSSQDAGRPQAGDAGLAEDAIKVLQEAMQSDDQQSRILAAVHMLDLGMGIRRIVVPSTFLSNRQDIVTNAITSAI